jgi:tape measure domain-containing protein
VAQANVKLTVDASQATRALQGVQSRTTQLNGGLNRLKTAIAGIGLTVLARQAVNTSANFAKLNVRLGLLTKASGTFARSQEIAANAQKAFGLSATEALEGITDITARLQPLGVGVEDIKSTFFGFNTAAKLAGASAIESSNAFRQLAQALGSGRLQGDEFRSISEQIPTLLAPISDELGVTVGELKKFASEGKLTSEVVLRALRKIETDGGASLKALLENDPTQVFKNLSNETENLSRAFGEVLEPVVIPVIKGFTELTIAATNFVNSPIGKTAAIFSAIAVAAKGVAVLLPVVAAGLQKVAFAGGVATIALNALPFVAVATLVGGFTTAIIKAAKEQRDFNKALKEGDIQMLKSEFNRLFIERQKILKKINENEDTSNRKVLQSLKKQLKANEDNLNPIKERLDTVIKENAVEKEKNKTTKKNKEIQEESNKLIKDNLKKAIAYEQAEMDSVKAKGKLIDRLSNQRALAQEAIDGNLKEVQTQQEINALVAIHGEGLRDIITKYIEGTNALKKQKEVADELEEKFKDIGEEIEGSIKNNLRDAITGAQSFGQAMTNVLNRIRDKIIDAQIDKLLGNFGESFGAKQNKGGLGGFLGNFAGGLLGGLFKANGGPVKAGQPYIVGERQPELFVPRTSGTILPSVPTGGGNTTNNMITVNVDATGSSVQGNGSEADQLGGLIASVVQATIIDEQRSGGLLNR